MLGFQFKFAGVMKSVPINPIFSYIGKFREISILISGI